MVRQGAVDREKRRCAADEHEQFARFGDFLKKAHDAHAVAIIGGQGGGFPAGMHLTHTGAMGFDTYYEIPVVSMIAEGQQLLGRFLDQASVCALISTCKIALLTAQWIPRM
jgi:hypothetical protein